MILLLILIFSGGSSQIETSLGSVRAECEQGSRIACSNLISQLSSKMIYHTSDVSKDQLREQDIAVFDELKIRLQDSCRSGEFDDCMKLMKITWSDSSSRVMARTEITVH